MKNSPEQVYIKTLYYLEEVNSEASSIHDEVEEIFKKRYKELPENFKFNINQSDKIWEVLQEVLEDFSEYKDYRNYN